MKSRAQYVMSRVASLPPCLTHPIVYSIPSDAGLVFENNFTMKGLVEDFGTSADVDAFCKGET
jgi:hypothetical protein